MTTESRVSRLEAIAEQISERLAGLERGQESIRTELHTNFRWIIGIILVQWVTVLAAVLGALLTR